MLEDKRKFQRYDLSLITQLKSPGGGTRHSLGLTKNFSREGLSIEARDYKFVPEGSLQLELRSPEGNKTVSLLGNVVWKKRAGNTNVAGMKLSFQDENAHNAAMEKLFAFGKTSDDAISAGSDATNTGEAPISGATADNTKAVPATQERIMGFKKEYLESGECKVTFRFPKEAASDAKEVAIVGDFNDWDIHAAPMKRVDSGDFQITLNLHPEKEYRFRYLIDGSQWENDWQADKYIPNDFGSDDSVIIL